MQMNAVTSHSVRDLVLVERLFTRRCLTQLLYVNVCEYFLHNVALSV